MDDLKKLQEDQAKTQKNNQNQGEGNPDRKLPNKQHSTNK